MLKEKRITLKDIAELVGVSKAAVSGVLNNSKKISCNSEKRRQIFELVKKYNYVPQSAARALSTKRAYQIGFIVSSKVTLGLANAYFSTLMAGAQQTCQQRGYLLTVAAHDFLNIEDFAIPQKLNQRSVDGIIIAGSTAPEVVKRIQKFDIPFVLFSDPQIMEPLYSNPKQNNFICLSCDNQANQRLAIEYFARLGHKKIALSRIPYQSKKNFYDIGNQQKLEIVEISEASFEHGRKLAEKWLNTPKTERYTALYACDQTCCGFLSNLHESGQAKCPDDISIISGTETEICNWIYPKLTAINSNAFRHGAAGADVLIDILDNKLSFDEARKEAWKFYKPGEIVIRNSCAKKG